MKASPNIKILLYKTMYSFVQKNELFCTKDCFLLYKEK